MSAIKASNGQAVTDEMINDWCEALDKDEWPGDWENVGEILNGKLPQETAGTEVLSVKIPAAMKKAVEREARIEGVSMSAYVRDALAASLIETA